MEHALAVDRERRRDELRARERLEQAGRERLLARRDGPDVVDRAGRNPGGAQPFEPRGAALGPQPLLEQLPQLRAMLDAGRVRGETGVGDELGQLERRTEAGKEPVVA